MMDAVVTWVDATDPKVNHQLTDTLPYDSKRIGKRNSLKYCLRGLYYNLPWLNTIFLVTNDQWPAWLNEEHSKELRPKIIRVDHKDIHPEKKAMYGSCAIECCLDKIPNLTDYFLYANDDTFVIKPMAPTEWIDQNGFGIYKNKVADFKREDSAHSHRDYFHYSLRLQYQLACSLYKDVDFMMANHQVSIFCKKAFEVARTNFPELYKTTCNMQFRTSCDQIGRLLIEYIALKENFCLLDTGFNQSVYSDPSQVQFPNPIVNKDTKLLCINHIYKYDKLPILEELFPKKLPSEY